MWQNPAMVKASDRLLADRIEVARRLNAAIEALGYSKASFARSIGANPGQMHHWLIGGNWPPTPMVITIARVHRIGPEWLLLGQPAGLPVGVAEKIQRILDRRNSPSTRR